MAEQQMHRFQCRPTVPLHRFDAEPSAGALKCSPGPDGVEMVEGPAEYLYEQLAKMAKRSKKQQLQNNVDGKAIEFVSILGPSFFQLDDVYLEQVHDPGNWEGKACHVTKTSEPLGASFVMVPTHVYKHPPRLKGSPPEGAEHVPKVVGVHYSLAPLDNMPKADFLQQLEDMKESTPCTPCSAATALADAWPPEVETPSNFFMVPDVYALRALRFCDTEQDINVMVRAGLEYITLSAEDMYVDDLLEVPAQAAFVLYALERYEPPSDDPYLVIKCDALFDELWEGLYGDADTSDNDSSEEELEAEKEAELAQEALTEAEEGAAADEATGAHVAKEHE